MAYSPGRPREAGHRRQSSMSRTMSRMKSVSRRGENASGEVVSARRGDMAMNGPIPIAEVEDEDASIVQRRIPIRPARTDLETGARRLGSPVDFTTGESAAMLGRSSSEDHKNSTDSPAAGFSDRRTSRSLEHSRPNLRNSFKGRRRPRKLKSIVTKFFGGQTPESTPLPKREASASETSLQSLRSFEPLSPPVPPKDYVRVSPELASSSPVPSFTAAVARERRETPSSSRGNSSVIIDDGEDTIVKRIRQRHETLISTLPALAPLHLHNGSKPRPYSVLSRSVTTGSGLSYCREDAEQKQRSKSISTTTKPALHTFYEGVKRHKSDVGLNWRQSQLLEELSGLKSAANRSSPNVARISQEDNDNAVVEHGLTVRPTTSRYGDPAQLESRIEHLERRLAEVEKLLENGRISAGSVRNLSSPSSVKMSTDNDHPLHHRESGYASAFCTPRTHDYHPLRPVTSRTVFETDAAQTYALDQLSDGSTSYEPSPARERRLRSLSTSTTVRPPPMFRKAGSPKEQTDLVSLTSSQYNSLIGMIHDEQQQRRKLETQILMLTRQIEFSQHGMHTPLTATIPSKPFAADITQETTLHSPRPEKPGLFAHFERQHEPERSSFTTDAEDGMPESAFETSSAEFNMADDFDDLDEPTPTEARASAVLIRNMSLSRLTLTQPMASVTF